MSACNALRSALQPAIRGALRPATRAVNLRTFSVTSRKREGDEPASYAATQDHITQDYVKPDGSDIGHSTTGPGVGKHNQRTLASLSFEGKVCVVTGAARGLGNIFARTFAESGSNAIAIIDLDEGLASQAAEELSDWFVKHGQAKPHEIEAIGIGCDVSKEEQVKEAMAKVVEKFGRIDVLVFVYLHDQNHTKAHLRVCSTSAGIVPQLLSGGLPDCKYKQVMSINVDGTFFCAREAAKHMLASGKGGSMVLVGSMSDCQRSIDVLSKPCDSFVAVVPQPQAPYNASKAAVKHLAASLAVEWAQQGIRVNCLAPGYMATALTRAILDNNPTLKETWTRLTPMGRVGEPEDLKGAIVYLASDASAFTTGISLDVDGGYCLT